MTIDRRAAAVVLLAVAVGLAFADSSIVMLGLPEIYGELDASILGASFVITSYNLVVAVVAFALIPVMRRTRPLPVLVAGLAIFAAASLGCGLAPDLSVLVVLRGVQGLGGAMLLAASLPALVALAGAEQQGRAIWALAGSAGAVLGPAVGGIITELADWRAIFIVQAPLAAIALPALADRRLRGLGVERDDGVRPPLWSQLGLVFAFGALVGALFLAVLLIVTVWGFGPLGGAVVVSALPVAAVLVAPLSRRVGPGPSCLAGAPVLAAGLVGLALVRDVSGWWAGAALAVCGAGFGLLVPPLTHASVTGGSGLAVAATRSVAARHVGLVAALVIVAPLLAVDLEEGGDRATLEATRVILDARLDLQDKVPLALDLAEEFDRTPRGAVPDLAKVFAARGAAGDPSLAVVRDDLLGAIEDSITRAFRNAFLVSALFAILALVPVMWGLSAMRREAGGRAPPLGAIAGVGAVAVAAVALVVGALAAGGQDLGDSKIADPCVTRVREGGGGFDATLQGVVLDGLAGAACDLGVTREGLVLSFAPDSVGAEKIPWSPAQIEESIRAGTIRAIDDAEDRGSLNSVVADVLRGIVRRAPIEELIRGGGAVSDFAGRVRDLDAGDVVDALRGLLP
ncbi:MAG TPA: MFS transporter [Miltoncostaeaceae bacterium]|nr:MFS transporter [Miltoncostaeaceae bacterium]